MGRLSLDYFKELTKFFFLIIFPQRYGFCQVFGEKARNLVSFV